MRIDRAFENVILPLSTRYLSIFASSFLEMYFVIMDLQESPHFVDVDPPSDFDSGLPRYIFFVVYGFGRGWEGEAKGLQGVKIKGEGGSRDQSS